MNRSLKLLFALISKVLWDKPVDTALFEGFDVGQFESLCAFARSHSLDHLLLNALDGLSAPFVNERTRALLSSRRDAAVYQWMTQDAALERICEAFEKERIAFIPLKGAVIRSLYPEQWMRSCCDIDILVGRSQLKYASDVLSKKLGFDGGDRERTHDISFTDASGVSVELHYELIEENKANDASGTLGDIWAFAHPEKEGSFRFVLSDEVFYYYHFAHMASHFESGGCGIRPFIDLVFLDRDTDGETQKKRRAFLEKHSLLTFAENCAKLSERWFGDNENSDPLTVRFEEYILTGGVYGTSENKYSLITAKKGKLGAFMHLLFPSVKSMIPLYPILKKAPVLLPFCWIARWIRAVVKGTFQKKTAAAKKISAASAESKKETARFLKDVGLNG